MYNIIEGKYIAENKSFAIVASRFNELVSQKLIDGALDCLKRHKADEKNITLIWVPGAFEIPSVAQKLADSDKYDAVICVGAVIRGDTPHFEYISAEVSKGIAQVGLKSKIPVIFGVLTTDTIEQALERAGTKAGNKGWDAALSAIEMVNLIEKLSI
ncbi:MAG: 6,7-dimethyl-8-ribityllumazine synthase [Candidatus Cloacimonadota bacterium]|nr:6,7-dimethyl-8-ribityllumazine synthase [Candidatus Cloacimonadota bacterium]